MSFNLHDPNKCKQRTAIASCGVDVICSPLVRQFGTARVEAARDIRQLSRQRRFQVAEFLNNGVLASSILERQYVDRTADAVCHRLDRRRLIGRRTTRPTFLRPNTGLRLSARARPWDTRTLREVWFRCR